MVKAAHQQRSRAVDQIVDAPAPASNEAESTEAGRTILERVRLALKQAVYKEVPLRQIRPMQNQPRKFFNEDRLQKLAISIAETGQITPGYLRRITPDAEGHEYELVDGERRYRANQLAGLSTFRAMVIVIDDQAAQFVVSTIANFNRENHTSLEISDCITVMHEEMKLGLAEIARSIGFSYNYTNLMYGLRRLIPEVRDMLDPEKTSKNNALPITAAIHICRLPSTAQLELAKRVISKQVPLRAVSGEVMSIARRSGLKVASQRSGSGHSRRNIERKVELAYLQVNDLKGIVEEMTPAMIRGWPNREKYRKQIGTIINEILSVASTLDRVSKE